MFAAVAVARYLQGAAEVSTEKLVQTLRTLHSVVIGIGEQAITADPTIGTDARTILDRILPITLRR